MKLLASLSDVISSEVVSVCNIIGNCNVLAGCGSTDLNSTIVVASRKNTKYRDLFDLTDVPVHFPSGRLCCKHMYTQRPATLLIGECVCHLLVCKHFMWYLSTIRVLEEVFVNSNNDLKIHKTFSSCIWHSRY
jgi:hypothetical protein